MLEEEEVDGEEDEMMKVNDVDVVDGEWDGEGDAVILPPLLLFV